MNEAVAVALSLWASAGITRTYVIWPALMETREVFYQLGEDVLGLTPEEVNEISLGKAIKIACVMQTFGNFLLAPVLLPLWRSRFFAPLPTDEVVGMAVEVFAKIMDSDPLYDELQQEKIKSDLEDAEERV
jgi:hypothetical protein